jgi:hypothetical protein
MTTALSLRARTRLAVPLALALVAGPLARPAHGQGSLSMQGYGYPTGQLSSRALATGGSSGEFDPASPINPSALASWGRSALTFQYDPEFRRVTSGAGSESATIARFPLIAFAIPLRQRLQVGLAASTLLDRTFSTDVPTNADVGGTTATGTQRIESRGSIADVRLGGAYTLSRNFAIGVAGHLLTGQNRVVSGRVFEDTTQFGNVSDSSTIDFSGLAVSTGAQWRVIPGFSVAGSYRRGGNLRVERNDTTLRSARSQDRWGVGVRIDRVAGASFTGSYANTRWSNLQGLGATTLAVHDAPEFAAGVEAAGPRMGGSALALRLGGRRRTLPFGLNGAEIRETAFAGGIGAPFSAGRAVFDLGLQHATRTPNGGTLTGVRERAFTLSIGVTVRP